MKRAYGLLILFFLGTKLSAAGQIHESIITNSQGNEVIFIAIHEETPPDLRLAISLKTRRTGFFGPRLECFVVIQAREISYSLDDLKIEMKKFLDHILINQIRGSFNIRYSRYISINGNSPYDCFVDPRAIAIRL